MTWPPPAQMQISTFYSDKVKWCNLMLWCLCWRRLDYIHRGVGGLYWLFDLYHVANWNGQYGGVWWKKVRLSRNSTCPFWRGTDELLLTGHHFYAWNQFIRMMIQLQFATISTNESIQMHEWVNNKAAVHKHLIIIQKCVYREECAHFMNISSHNW